MEVTKKYVRVTEAPARSSVWDKWHAGGWTKIRREMDRAEIEVQLVEIVSRSDCVVWAMRHELGHVGVAEDVIDGCGGSRTEAAEVFTDYDRWQNEVEAWTRAEKTLRNTETADFVLDCLNSYRRGLNVPDREWDEAVEIIAEMADNYELAEHIRQYVPIEPYDDELPPNCGEGPGFPPPTPREDEDEDESEEDESDDESDEDDSDSDSDDEDDQDEDEAREFRHDPGRDSKATLDDRWNDPNLIDRLASGTVSLSEAARELGTTTDTASPLAAAVAIRQ